MGHRGRLHRLAFPMIAAVLMTAACGQRPGVHAQSAAQLAPASLDRPAPAPLGAPTFSGGSTTTVKVSGGSSGHRSGPSNPLGIVSIQRVKLTTSSVAVPAQPRGPNPFALCPVQGPRHAWDDFGQPRYAGGFHLHQGIDIMSPAGTPIVAPFDGLATNSANTLGGNAVTVYGAAGYVYNAHLSRYGQLGHVTVGTIIGYVGNSGDAMGGPTHDHFEWHPGGGPAVDPFAFLAQVCN